MILTYLDKRIRKVIDNFTESDRARIRKTVGLFRTKGFIIGEDYLRKLTKHIWELRPGKIRLLFGMIEGTAVFVNVFIKKSQKTPLKEIKLAERRLSEYI